MGDRAVDLVLAALVVALAACASGGAAQPHRTSSVAPAADEARRADRADPAAGRLLGWMLDHRAQVSLVVSGGPAAAEVRWNVDVVRPLGSTFKTIVLAAYAREVAAGRLDPEEVVHRGEIGRWLVEGTDGASHATMIEQYATDDGMRLDDVAAAMIALSANTAADVLLDRLGREAIVQTADELGLPGLAVAAAPPAGALALLADVALGSTTAARLDAIAGMSAASADRLAWERSVTFAATPDVVAREILAGLSQLTTWEDQLRLAATLPWRASPSDVHALLVGLLVEGRLGEPATSIVRAHMSWPMADATLAGVFSQLAAKEGALPGTLAVHGVGRPRRGDAAGTDRAVVLSVHGLDDETWFAAVEAEELQALALRLIEDPAFAAAVREGLER